MTYLEKVVSYVVKEMRADLIHFDDLNLSPEPNSCRCGTCKDLFKKYLKDKYPDDEERKERFGHPHLDFVEPPAFDWNNLPWNLEIIRDPVQQEWIAFRCHYQSETYARLSRLIRELNPECAVEYNAIWCGIGAINTAYYAGVWLPQSAGYGDFYWTEEGHQAGVSDDGVLISKIRSYKAAQTLKNTVFTYVGTGDSVQNRLLMAECMAFNPRSLGMLGKPSADSPRPEIKTYIDFYREHQDRFLDLEPVADVAVLRSYASLSYNSYSTFLSVLLFEQTMIQAKIPFSIVFDEALEDPSRYPVLALANVESLSDAQIDMIRAYVENGGGLVATDQTSLYDQWRRIRRNYGLTDLFGTEYTEDRPDAGKTVRGSFGKGRVVYIPGILPAIDPPRSDGTGYHWIDAQYWRLPNNWEEIREAVTWAAGSLSAEISGPLTVTAQIWKQHNNRIVLSLVNYLPRQPVNEIEVRIAVPSDSSVEKVSVLSPDNTGVDTPSFKQTGGNLSFVIPGLFIYDLVEIDFR